MHKKIYLSVILGILFFVSCKDKKQYYEESGTVFHTLYTIKYEAPHILTDKIDAELQKFNLSLNPFNPNSIIAKVNNNEAVEVVSVCMNSRMVSSAFSLVQAST